MKTKKTNEAMHDFAEDNAIGKRGEAIFKRYLEKLGCSYEDVSEEKAYQDADIDFLVESRKVPGKTISVEVKNDQRIASTGNIFFETMSNVDCSTDGCFRKTKANLMAIVSESEKSIYFVNTAFLKSYVDRNSGSLRFIRRVPGSNSCGYLIPVRKISDNVRKVRYEN